MMMVTFHQAQQKVEVDINPSQVTMVKPWSLTKPDDGTMIYLMGGEHIWVSERIDQVRQKLSIS